MLISLLVLPLWAMYLFGVGIGPGLFSKVPAYIYVVIALLIYGIFFIVPFLLCLPVVIPFAYQQKNIGRIIIFRKFNDDLSKKPLRHIIKTDLSNYGHVFTLSDRNFKIKWYIKIPFLLGQMSFFHFRQSTISTKEQLKKLERKLSSKLWLNMNWLLSSSKIFSVKTIDAFWKETAMTLLKENSLIIFDTSYDTESLEWEFSEIKNLGYGSNIIAITNSENLREENKWKKIFASQKDLKIPVFYYNKKGEMPEQLDFDFTVARILAATIRDENSNLLKKGFLKRTIATTGIAVLLFLGSFFFLSPYVIPDLVGKFSPFGNQVITAYLQSKVHSLGVGHVNVVNQLIISHRIKENWKEKAQTVFLKYAGHHNASECRSIQSLMVEFSDSTQLKKYINLVLTAEPPIADSAASIVRNINPPTLDKIALQCIASKRIDVKDRGLILFKNITLDSNFTIAVIHLLQKSEPAKEPPAVHSSGFLDYQPSVSLIKSESDFYINLANLLKQNRFITNQLLQTLLNSTFYQLRIFASLTLAENNIALNINQLINATFLKAEARSFFFNESYMIHPYTETIDRLLSDFKNPASLPHRDTVTSLLNNYYFNIEDPGTLTALLSFAINNFPLSDFNRFTHNIPDTKINELQKALNNCIVNDDTPALYEKVQRVIRLAKPLLTKNISLKDINVKLKIAELLAYSGDISILPILKEAADDNIVLGKTSRIYLHDKKIKNILEILYENVKTTDKRKLYKSHDAQLLDNFLGTSHAF